MESNYSYPETGVSASNLRETVEYLTEIKPGRSFDNLRSLEKAGDYISGKFAEYGYQPHRQEYVADGQKYFNVIASAGKSKDEREVVVVGAHYDVAFDLPGADDNASAVAGLLEVARFAKRYEDELPCRIEFVAFTLEEPPYFRTEQMGSYVHAKSLFDKKMKVKGMICLEMIGYFTDAKNSQKYPIGLMKLFYPNEGNFIGVVSNFANGGLKKHTARLLKATKINPEDVFESATCWQRAPGGKAMQLSCYKASSAGAKRRKSHRLSAASSKTTSRRSG